MCICASLFYFLTVFSVCVVVHLCDFDGNKVPKAIMSQSVPNHFFPISGGRIKQAVI